jgi:hypothetical protein
VAVAEPLEGDLYGPLIHVPVVRSASPRIKGGCREPTGHIPFVGIDAVHSSGSIRPLGGSVVATIIVNQEGSLLGKGDTVVQGAGVVAVDWVPQRISLGPGRTAVGAFGGTVAMVVHRDKQLEPGMERRHGLLAHAFLQAHGGTVVHFLCTKEVEVLLFYSTHNSSDSSSSSSK